MRTEIAYWLEGDFKGLNLYIVGFSLEKIKNRPNKLKFLNGLGCAIYVAAFDFDDEDEDENGCVEYPALDNELRLSELDLKETMKQASSLPKFYSSNNLSALSGYVSSSVGAAIAAEVEGGAIVGSFKRSGSISIQDAGVDDFIIGSFPADSNLMSSSPSILGRAISRADSVDSMISDKSTFEEVSCFSSSLLYGLC